MILWMAFSALFALLVTLSARAAETASRDYGKPVRWIWLGALLTSAVAPGVVWLTGARWPGLLPWRETSSNALMWQMSEVAASSASPSLTARDAGFPFDRVALVLWISLSLFALVWFCWAWRRLARARATWHPATLREQRVLLSAASGPAVIGLYRPSIVVPRWLLSETASVQRMILLHEQEHARAGDHVLLALAPLLLVALPWNLPLWWQVKRLRLAIELDCDARVLRHGVCARDYGTLLLELAGTHGSTVINGASLVEPRTFLERRIMAMSAHTRRYRHVHALTATAAALLLAVAACETTTAMAPAREPQPDAQTATDEPLRETATRADVPRGVLYIVDGVVVGRHDHVMTALDHVAVGSIEVVKGAAAVDRFGPDASEGAIVVTTKDGRGKLPLHDRLLKDEHEISGAGFFTKPLYSENVLHGRFEKELLNHQLLPEKELLKDHLVTTHPNLYNREGEEIGKLRILEGEPKTKLLEKPVDTFIEVPEKRLEKLREGVSIKGDLELRGESQDVKITGEKLQLRVPNVGANQPLMLIDGREVTDAELRALDPNTIDNISILKNAAATSAYGEKGRFGVIIVQLKK